MRTNTFIGRFSLPKNVARAVSALGLKQHAIWLAVAILSISVSGSSALAKQQLESVKRTATEAPMPFVTPSVASPSVTIGHNVGAPPAECEVDSTFKKIGKCIINSANDVVIGDDSTVDDCKTNVYVDSSVTKLGFIKISKNGVLKVFDRTAQLPMRIETTGIDVFGNLEVGDAKCPIGTINSADKVQFTFTGGIPDKNNRLCSKSPCPGYTKGIQVEALGTLRMYGAKGVPNGTAGSENLSWTYLSAAAGPATGFTAKDGVKVPVPAGGNKTLQLAFDVSPATNGSAGWKANDWIAVATTSFSPWETEFVQLAADATKNGTGSTVTLKQPLAYYHFGGADPGKPSKYDADATKNFGVDERAEVGLISRNIKLTSDTVIALPDTPSTLVNHWGGEMKFLAKFTEVSIQGVELEKFGKEQLGSYPVHFHMDGDLTANKSTALLNANSIHHSYNKCIAVHSTQNLSGISNNVCGRITGGIFYEEIGDEKNISFTRNLGMGAMSNSWDVNTVTNPERCTMLQNFYWAGDNMAGNIPGCPKLDALNDINFDQITIFDTADQTAPVHGTCGHPAPNGGIFLGPVTGKDNKTIPASIVPTCAPPFTYFEMPTGFWITNPSIKLVGNSIAGCQDTGKAYYYVSPGGAVGGIEPKFIPIGARYADPKNPDKYGVFDGNRAHGCYSGLYDEPEQGITSDQLFGYENAAHDSKHNAVADEFTNFTVSRIRDRGIWIRPTFYVASNVRAATIRDAVSLVTSGGVDGNYPGVWGMLRDSVVVGMSQNNVDRWGPCPNKISQGTFGQLSGGDWGCIDQTNPKNNPGCDPLGLDKNLPKCTNPVNGVAFTERGFDLPDWPMFGFLIYDGPPLILHDRFVNFRIAPGSVKKDPGAAANLLTKADDTVLQKWGFFGGYTSYEGDAALGWFNANQSSYPAASTTDRITFTNVDLRHQVYTAAVNRGDFTDGDQNTTILDLDGTLAGVTALANDKKTALPSISLNNLPINASSNSVDECLSQGSEDLRLEGRPTAAMEPNGLGQLEFEQLWPAYQETRAFKHTQLVTFTKNTTDFDPTLPKYHGTMPLKSRDGKGTWEPKVTNGYGYTVTASKYKAPDGVLVPIKDDTHDGQPAIGGPLNDKKTAWGVDLTLTDIVNTPNITKDNPFYVQLGMCFTNQDGSHPKSGDLFKITRGFRSYGGGNVVTSPSVSDALKANWTGFLKCNNLDFILQGGDDSKSNVLPPACPSVSGNSSPTDQLTPVDDIKKMTTDGNLNGKPNLSNFFYDSKNGWLFLWVAQTEPNAQGQSPLGNCKGNSDDADFCPENTTEEAYYVCPAQGCREYRVVLNDSTYNPGESKCGNPYSDDQGYEWPGPPSNENTLVVANTKTAVKRGIDTGAGGIFPHYTSATSLSCPVTTSIVP